ncbi:MAG: M48 family metallopeptidase [Alphaproteobacteria bacterium]|tara:strand:+ start:1630 stop:2313 length:684 start_codon:yes stop_codon:yes gene_type:complete
MKYNFNISIKRTNRLKTVSLKVKNQEVVLSVPKFVTDSEIDNIIERKINWIRNKLAIEKTNNFNIKKKYENGEKFLYFGSEYSLKIKHSNSDNVYLDNNIMIVEVKNNSKAVHIRNILNNWYIAESKKYLIKTTNYYEVLIGVSVNKLIFGKYKSKWGSCNSKKTISYDWRIIMAPLEVIHYLIIHELCHIKHLNHSNDFWKTVEKYMANYKLQKKWLKTNSSKLIL